MIKESVSDRDLWFTEMSVTLWGLAIDLDIKCAGAKSTMDIAFLAKTRNAEKQHPEVVSAERSRASLSWSQGCVGRKKSGIGH